VAVCLVGASTVKLHHYHLVHTQCACWEDYEWSYHHTLQPELWLRGKEVALVVAPAAAPAASAAVPATLPATATAPVPTPAPVHTPVPRPAAVVDGSVLA